MVACLNKSCCEQAVFKNNQQEKASSTTYRLVQDVFYPRNDFFLKCAKFQISFFLKSWSWAFENGILGVSLLSLRFSDKFIWELRVSTFRQRLKFFETTKNWGNYTKKQKLSSTSKYRKVCFQTLGPRDFLQNFPYVSRVKTPSKTVAWIALDFNVRFLNHNVYYVERFLSLFKIA